MAHDTYDEFSLFHENAAEWDLELSSPPIVERFWVTIADGRRLSGLRWGAGHPTMVFLHGGAQNAHTYDTVALAIGVDLVCIDLPGHGHSDGGAGGSLDPVTMAQDVVEVIETVCDRPITLVGMSLGGLCAISVAAARADLIERLALIDITPGVTGAKASHITDFINGPAGFDSFDDLVARTMAFNPTRSESSLRRGILHNAVQLDDGTWVWRWARHRDGVTSVKADRVDLWPAVASLTMPVLLVRGMATGSVVDDEDEARFLLEAPHPTLARVDGAGHSVQGDQPLELAELLRTFTP